VKTIKMQGIVVLSMPWFPDIFCCICIEKQKQQKTRRFYLENLFFNDMNLTMVFLVFYGNIG